MVGASASEIIFISVNQSITLMGKVWLIFMIFLRILLLLLAGYPLYQDEQERFVCNTIQPGCANVCYDLFSPVSLFRFWLVQLATLCLPYVFFIIYVVHKVSNVISVALNSAGHAKAFQLFKVHQESINKVRVNEVPVVLEQQEGPRCFSGAYILHLLFRTLLEVGFGAAHYYLFGFYIPRRFLCQHAPCTTQVDCYISRPTEKTVMLNFMFAVAALSLFFDVLDFICAINRSVKQKLKKKTITDKVLEEASVASTGKDPNITLGQQNRESQSRRDGVFRKREGSGGEMVIRNCSNSCPIESPCCNNGNDFLVPQEEVLERNGSEVALCPKEPLGTPRSIRVNKRSRLKPPPPPRRDLGLTSEEAVAPVTTETEASSRRLGQYVLVELGDAARLQANDDGPEKRSEWV